MPQRSPWLARLLAKALLPRRDREFILGDIEELFVWREASEGSRRAARLYVRDVLRSILARVRPNLRRHMPQPQPPGRRSLMTGLVTDMRAAVRTLRREPGFVALAVFTLALGIGSTAAVFGMINQLLLRPLPGVSGSNDVAYVRFYPSPDAERYQVRGLTTLDFDVMREESSLLDGVATYGLTRVTIKPANARPIGVFVNTVYGDFFEVLGVRPSEGRLLSGEETDLLADPGVAVISEDLRARLFEPGDRVAGRTLEMNGTPMMIVGVAGHGFKGPERGSDIDVWVPYGALVPLINFPPDNLRSRRSTMHSNLVVRLREGASIAAAQAEQSTILAQLAANSTDYAEYLGELNPVFSAGLHVPPTRRDTVYASLRTLAGVVILVLFIACANVANLLLVRNVRRRGSLAMHRALGASTARIARRHIAESMGFAGLGTLAGLLVAYFIGLTFRGEQFLAMPEFEGFTLDWRVLVFAAAAAIGTALLFGALPALLAGRFDLHSALKASGQRETGRFASVRAILSGSQIALSLALLVGAVLLTSTLRNLYAVDTGFDIENVVALSLEEPDGLDGPALNAWRRDLLATIGGVPGVGRVALDLYGPLGSQMNGRMRLPETPLAEATMAAVFPVTPGWFEIVGLETMSGRTFGAPDWSPDGVARVLVTESLARRLFGRTDVVGQRFFGGMRGNEEVEVIGVTHDIRHAYAPEQPQDAMFMILDAAPLMPTLTALAETSSHDGAILRAIRSAVETIVPDKAVPDPVPVMNRVDNAHAEKRMFSRLLSLLSAFAVLLAAVGLYGTIAFDVNGRRREFGVRLALGARPNRIGFLVMRYAASVVGGGIALGLFVAYGLSQVLESRLFGVAPTDLRSYGLGAVLFATVAFVACIAPVLTAVRVNPVVTLKGE